VRQEEKEGNTALEEARRIEDEVCQRVEEELSSSAIQAKIEAKLMEERARLEMKVSQTIELERRALLQKERKRLADEMKHRRELANILAENQRKVQDALRKAEEERAASKEKLSLSEGIFM